jgi:hypothetical protein
MPVQSPAVPLGDKGHYTFLFPVRPGETRFQISYHLAYSGSIQLAPRHALQMDTVAIMLPKSMSFKPGAASNYIAVTEDTTAQTYVARNVAPSQPLDFTLSGAGQLPRDQENPGPGNNSQADASAPNPSGDTRPGGGLGVPIDTPDPLSKYKWWIIGGLLLLFAGGAGFMLSRPAVPAGATVPAPAIAGQQLAPSRPQALLEALKEELFTLETEHLAGSLSEADYAAQKAALDVVLRRAIRRQN